MKQKNVIPIMYYLLFCVSKLFPAYENHLFLLITCFNITLFLNNKNRLFMLLSALCFSSELFQIINLFVYLVLDYRFIGQRIKIPKWLFVSILLIFTNTVINSIFNNCLPNAITALFYYSILICLFFQIKDKYSLYRILVANRYFIWLQFTCNIIILFKYRVYAPGDSFMGTFSDAHTLGIWAIMSLILIISYRIQNHRLHKSDYMNIIFLLIMIGMADAKAVVVGACISVLLYAALKKLISVQYQLGVFIISIYIILVIILQAFSFPPIKNIVEKFGASIYIYNEHYNFKFRYFYETLFEQLKGERLLFGYGMGQYGSRFANLFAYNIMYRNPSSINRLIASLFSPHYISEYAQYASLYSDAIVRDIRWRSAVLTYPFSSLFALIGENGLMGVLLTAYFINKNWKYSLLKLEVFFFITICIFDLYLDHLNLITFLLLLVNNSKNWTGQTNKESRERLETYESNFSI